MARVDDIKIGQRFNHFIISSKCVDRTQVEIRCDCGSVKVVKVTTILDRGRKSCGCMKTKYTSLCKNLHRDKFRKTGEYHAWCAMKGRCNNKKNKSYLHYGGRGISICKRWHSFDFFIEDMGRKPSSHYSIDRINVNGNYEPSNCRWATRKEQNSNTRRNVYVVVNDESVTLSEASRLIGVRYGCLISRYYKGLRGDALLNKNTMKKGQGLKPVVIREMK